MTEKITHLIKPERLQKILARAGIASRRKSEELIKQGKVTINGKIATIGNSATPKDEILVEGKPIIKEKLEYWILHKPTGAVSTTEDPHAEFTARQLIATNARIYPVGRLDKNAEGLMLFTNDGELANKILHPRYETQKTYIATTNEQIKEHQIKLLREGVIVEKRIVEAKGITQQAKNTIELTIHEGRKHIVKKLLETIGLTVIKLIRTKIGTLTLDTSDLKKGKSRQLTNEELRILKASLN